MGTALYTYTILVIKMARLFNSMPKNLYLMMTKYTKSYALGWKKNKQYVYQNALKAIRVVDIIL